MKMPIGLDWAWAGFNISTSTAQVIRETVLQVKRPNQQHQSTVKENSWPATDQKRLQTHHPPCYKWTSKKRKILSQRDSLTQQAGLYQSCIDCATIDATQHFSKTGLGILYLLAPSQHQWWNVAEVWRENDWKCWQKTGNHEQLV